MCIGSKVIKEDGDGKPFRIHDPKEADDSTLKRIEHKIQEFEYFLKDIKNAEENEKTGLSVNEVVKVIIKADTAKKPKLSYTVGKDAFFASLISKLPQNIINKLIKFGIKLRMK